MSNIVDLIFLYFLFLLENFSPISPILQAPRIESVTACKTGSPSECPNVPSEDGILIPPKYSFLLGTNLCTSKPIPCFKFFLSIISDLIVILELLISPFMNFTFLFAAINKFASSVILDVVLF